MIKKIFILISFLFISNTLFAADDVVSTARQLATNADYYKALMEYTKALKTEKNNPDLLFERGEVKYHLENYSGAIVDYTSSLKLETSSQTYIARGKAFVLDEQYDKALADFNEALKFEESAKVYGLMSDANYKKDDFKNSIENYTNAIRLMPDAFFYVNRGMVYQRIKDYDSALQDYTKAIELDANNVEYYTLRYELYNIMQKFDLAEEDKATIDTINENYDSAIKKLSGILNNKQDYLLYYKIGLLKNRIEDYSGAIDSFTESINLKNTPEALLERGKSKVKLKKYNGAFIDFNQSLKLKKTASAYFEIAQTYCLSKKYEQSIEFYNKAIKLEHNNIDIIIGKLEALYELEKYRDVILEIPKYNVMFNDDIRLIDLMAKAEYKIGLYNEALKDLEKSLSVSPKIETYLLIAEIYEKTKDYRKAILNYTIAIDMEKENVGFMAKQNLKNFYSKRENLYMLIKRPDLAQADRGYQSAIAGSYRNNVAIADFTKSLEMKQNSEIYIARGELKLKNQDYQDAMDDFSKALELKPTSSVAFLRIGQTQMAMDEDEKALENFNNALDLGGEEDETYVAFAKLMEKQGKIDDAIRYYSKALRIKEKRAYYLARAELYEKILKNDLAMADKGNIKVMFNNYKSAIADYTKSLEIYENAFVFAKRGRIEERIGMYEQALNDYIKAIEMDKTGVYLPLKKNLLSKLSKEQKTIFELKQFEKILFAE